MCNEWEYLWCFSVFHKLHMWRRNRLNWRVDHAVLETTDPISRFMYITQLHTTKLHYFHIMSSTDKWYNPYDRADRVCWRKTRIYICLQHITFDRQWFIISEKCRSTYPSCSSIFKISYVLNMKTPLSPPHITPKNKIFPGISWLEALLFSGNGNAINVTNLT